MSVFAIHSHIRFPLIAAGVAVVLSVLLADDLIDTLSEAGLSRERLTYSQFLEQVSEDRIVQVEIDEVTGRVVGVSKDDTRFETRAPGGRVSDADIERFDQHNVGSYASSQPHILAALLFLWLLPICLAIVVAFWWGKKCRAMRALMGIPPIRGGLLIGSDDQDRLSSRLSDPEALREGVMGGSAGHCPHPMDLDGAVTALFQGDTLSEAEAGVLIGGKQGSPGNFGAIGRLPDGRKTRPSRRVIGHGCLTHRGASGAD